MFSFENDRVRFCSRCNLNVYNLSGMRKEEAEALIMKTEGRLCVRFYRKADGSILTQDCPVGLKAIKQRVSWFAQVALGMAVSIVSNLGLYIFHLGKEPFPDLRYTFTRREVMGGMVMTKPALHSETEPSVMGASLYQPQRNVRAPQGKAKKPIRKLEQ
jgi:hypothetical protein